MAGLPEVDVARVRRWCAQHVPEHARGQIRMEFETAPQQLTLLECRAPRRQDLGPQWTRYPVARFHYAPSTGHWTLYWRDRNLTFHRYDRLPPTPDLESLLEEVEHDPAHLFWG